MKINHYVQDEAEMMKLGKEIAQGCDRKDIKVILYFQGELGVGKTTLIRGIIHGFAYSGKVRSPSYNLVEDYEINGRRISHFDLYRLKSPEELEWMGIRDYFLAGSVGLIEWPEKGQGYLPESDLTCEIKYAGDRAGRHITLIPNTGHGQLILQRGHIKPKE
jgi:tRNA threonylcarbamoyladenosine biosynthesis protein TsaE